MERSWVDKMLGRNKQEAGTPAVQMHGSGDRFVDHYYDWDNLLYFISPEVLPVVDACVRLIANAVARCRLQVKRQTTEKHRMLGAWGTTPNHVLNKVLMQPHADWTSTQMLERLVKDILLWGNAYLHVGRGGDYTPVRLTPLYARDITVSTQSNGDLHYKNGRLAKLPTYNKLNILHFTNGEYYGVSGASPVLTIHAQTIHRACVQHAMQAKIERQRLGLRVSTEIPADNSAITDEQRKDIRDNLRRNGIEAVITPKGMKLTQMPTIAEDLDLNTAIEETNKDLCRIFGVPGALVGVVEVKNATVSLEDRKKTFLDLQVVPIMMMIEQVMTRWLLKNKEINDGFAIKFDYSALPYDRDWAKVASTDGAITINEARARMDFPPIDGGDTLLSPKGAPPQQNTGMEADEQPTDA